MAMQIPQWFKSYEATLSGQNPQAYTFSTLGIVALIGIAVLLAANEKTGPAIVFLVAALILLVILVNYKQVMSVFFVKEG